jgi:hypothetical protein
MTDYVPPTDRRLMRMSRAELQKFAASNSPHAESAQDEIERRRLNRQRKRSERQKIAPVPEQLSVDEELDAKEGFDDWDVFKQDSAA